MRLTERFPGDRGISAFRADDRPRSQRLPFQIHLPMFSCGPGMVLGVSLCDRLKTHVSVNLGRVYIYVPEDRLYRAKVRAIFQHMRCATVAKHVRTDMPDLLEILADDLPEPLPRKRLPLVAREKPL